LIFADDIPKQGELIFPSLFDMNCTQPDMSFDTGLYIDIEEAQDGSTSDLSSFSAQVTQWDSAYYKVGITHYSQSLNCTGIANSTDTHKCNSSCFPNTNLLYARPDVSYSCCFYMFYPNVFYTFGVFSDKNCQNSN